MRKLFLKLVFSMTERFMCSGKQHLGEFVNAGALSALVCSNLSLLQTAQIEHPPNCKFFCTWEISWMKQTWKASEPSGKKTLPTGPTCRFYHVWATWFHGTASAFPEVWISVRWRMWWQIHPVSWSQVQLRSDAAMAWYYSWDPMSLSDDGRSMIPGIPDFKGKECPILFWGVRSGFCMNFICFQHLQDSLIQNAWVCLFAHIGSALLNP